MKKGISLIVLVITIIVMIIIAGAIIFSLNGTNVVNRADEAVLAADEANLRSALTLEYAEIMALNYDDDDDNDVVQTSTEQGVDTAEARYAAVFAKFPSLQDKFEVKANTDLTFTITEK